MAVNQKYQKYSTAALLLRSLKPSGASAFLCILLAFLLVAANIVLQSVGIGTALPGLLDGQWAIAYTEHVVQPLTEILSSNTLNKVLIAGLWGLAGFVVYIGFEYVIHLSQNLRESRQNIRMARGNVIERPLSSSFWLPVLWRIAVLIGGIIFLIASQPLLGHALNVAQTVLLSTNLIKDGLMVVLAVAEWTLVLHGLVVFLRLYTQRTRLFGDDELY
jgi:hypothetical protein